MSIKSLLTELKQAYAEAGLDCGDGLLPPAPKTQLDSLAFELSMPLPVELLAVYAVHGGQVYFGAGVTGLFGSHRLNLPTEVVSIHRNLCEFWMAHADFSRLIPFATWDAYSLCVDAESGEVWEFAEQGGAELDCHRPSISAVLREMLEAVRAGEEPVLSEYRESAG